MMVSMHFTADPNVSFDKGALRNAVGHWLDMDGRILDKDGKVIGEAFSVWDDPITGAYVVTAEVTDPEAIAMLSIGMAPGISATVVKDGGTVIPGDE